MLTSRLNGFLICFILLTPAMGDEAEPKTPVQAIRNAPQIGVGDTITINAFHCEEISKAWQVGSSGTVDLPMVGRIRVAGLTPEQVEEELKTRLGKFLYDPKVSVVVTEYRSGPVTITGAVEQPGTRQLQGNKRLFDSVMLANGLKDNAAFVTLSRHKERGPIPHPAGRETEDGRFYVARFPISEVREGRGPAANILILPDDVIGVEAAKPKLVYVIGEVTKPGAIELATQPTIPLTKALALAGGMTHIASLKHVILRRSGENGVATEVSIVDANRILKDKAKDLQISEGYVIIIPSNDLKNYLQTVSQSALNAGVYSGLQILARF